MTQEVTFIFFAIPNTMNYRILLLLNILLTFPKGIMLERFDTIPGDVVANTFESKMPNCGRTGGTMISFSVTNLYR